MASVNLEEPLAPPYKIWIVWCTCPVCTGTFGYYTHRATAVATAEFHKAQTGHRVAVVHAALHYDPTKLI